MPGWRRVFAAAAWAPIEAKCSSGSSDLSRRASGGYSMTRNTVPLASGSMRRSLRALGRRPQLREAQAASFFEHDRAGRVLDDDDGAPAGIVAGDDAFHAYQ
jgi:hypothetical protein